LISYFLEYPLGVNKKSMYLKEVDDPIKTTVCIPMSAW